MHSSECCHCVVCRKTAFFWHVQIFILHVHRLCNNEKKSYDTANKQEDFACSNCILSLKKGVLIQVLIQVDLKE